MHRKLNVILSLVLLLGLSSALSAQNNKRGSVLRGMVTTLEDGIEIPLEGAVVNISNAGLYAVTDKDGKFSFTGLDNGKYEVLVQFIGYVDCTKTATVSSGKDTQLVFRLEESTFRLEEVSVVAEKSKAGDATASLISRQAIDHSQTSSLKDVMQLLPGVSFSNPDLSENQTINLRTAVGSDMNSLGTAIIMDGAPISNNANMDGIMSAITGVNSTIATTGVASYGASPNSGIDVRSISTDNVSSVEVIRGIPSVQYGDLTSGAVIINSKAGAEPFTVRLKTDPKIYQASLSKGIRLGGKAGSLHFSGDYAHSNSSTTEAYAYYQRFNFKTLWSSTFGKLNTNTSLDLNFGKDTRERNPDDERSMLSTGGTSIGYRFNTNGTWSINKGWLKSIHYDVSNSFTNKESFKEQMMSNAVSIYSTNMTDGTTVSNIVGRHLYDIDGNEITNFKEGQTDFANFTPYSYFSHYDFYGKELNTFAKLSANLFKAWGETSEKILVGADFKSDGNLGQGLVFPVGLPPHQSSNPVSGFRERPLYDIPFVNQFGVYAENTFKTEILDRVFNLTAGARYDNVNGLDAISPRLNASLDILPGAFTLRGGYGIAAKAPTSAYLYPNNAYCDLAMFNNSESDPDGKVAFATTYVFDTSNPGLEIAKNRKAEIGFDLTMFQKYQLSVTFYDELMKNGYALDGAFNTFVLLPYSYYAIAGHSDNGEPLFAKTVSGNRFFNFYSPMNHKYEHNYGIEYELNLGRFESIRTSFFLSGAYMHTISGSSAESYELRQKNGSYVDANVAIFDPGRSYSHYEKFLTSLRTTHNIPSIGFVVTLTTQFTAFTNSWNVYDHEEYPQRYISAADGKVYEFTEAMRSDPAYKYMFDILSNSRFIVNKTIPTVVFNLNLSKEIGDFLTASFYVNNLFNSRPLDKSEIGVGYSELNLPMYFGFEVKMKF